MEIYQNNQRFLLKFEYCNIKYEEQKQKYISITIINDLTL
jgi:hypothetical protein